MLEAFLACFRTIWFCYDLEEFSVKWDHHAIWRIFWIWFNEEFYVRSSHHHAIWQIFLTIPGYNLQCDECLKKFEWGSTKRFLHRMYFHNVAFHCIKIVLSLRLAFSNTTQFSSFSIITSAVSSVTVTSFDLLS